MRMDISTLLRPNIRALQPYTTARHEFSGQADVFLDANESPYPEQNGLNRYPDPNQVALKRRIADLKELRPEQLFLGNGSDEAIDLLFRLFCEPGRDQAIICPPTYGMYAVSAGIHNTPLIEVPLTADFQLDVPAILAQRAESTKLLFLCTPNNPSGNDFRVVDVEALLEGFSGIVVIDEAYVDFAGRPSWAIRLEQYPKLVVLQTFSKAWGLAGLRLGLAAADPAIIDYFNRIKAPYNLSSLTQQYALTHLPDQATLNVRVQEILAQRAALATALNALPQVQEVFPSAANFLLVRFDAARATYDSLLEEGIITRDRSRVLHGDNCLRITVGTPKENEQLIATLQNHNL